MTVSWREWEGRTVDGKFVLGSYLGGSEGSAVFRMRAESVEAADPQSVDSQSADPQRRDAAIKLGALSGAEAESQLRRWQAAIGLNHPNLLRILKTGRDVIDGREVVYAIEELAEENLAQIVPERALASEEARAMLAPVLSALDFMHARRLVHGRIRPSNIFAVGDQVKLSSDTLRPAGDIPPTVTAYDAPEVLADGVSPASDFWSLGITLVEVLTQRVPAWDAARMELAAPGLDKNLPEPFRGIVQRCLQVDPAKRPGASEIARRLGAGPEERRDEKRTPAATVPVGKSAPVDAIAASARKRANGPYLLVLAAAIVVTIFLIVRPRPSTGPAEDHASSSTPQISTPQSTAPQASAPPTSPAQTTQTAPAELPPSQSPSRAAQPSSDQKTPLTDEIVEQAMPQVAPSARRTISGKLKVRVRVEVDASGNVTEAKLKDAGPSQYFAKAALDAARRWKFSPAAGEDQRNWTLLFAFTRARTEMSATRAR